MPGDYVSQKATEARRRNLDEGRWEMTEEEYAQDEKDGIPRPPAEGTGSVSTGEPEHKDAGESKGECSDAPEHETTGSARPGASAASQEDNDYAESLQCEHGGSLWTCEECYRELRAMAMNDSDKGR
ncbi:hypothetical protein LTR36_005258 [Oleoguttula mirabilis]|uniref:Uncharacterized protein n=1 Tax=Oleoguttula mirabilis TaxID=1507867 RepID=A0AAV9JFN8_9PEZI|nr:hypothetical protein LTR36_005258 [Oleoguttula mirabilis]